MGQSNTDLPVQCNNWVKEGTLNCDSIRRCWEHLFLLIKVFQFVLNKEKAGYAGLTVVHSLKGPPLKRRAEFMQKLGLKSKGELLLCSAIYYSF